MRRRHIAAAAATLLAVFAPIAALATSPTNDELYRWAYAGQYPMWCYDASNANAKLRTQPALQNNVKALHAATKAYIACAKTPQAQHVPAMINQSLLGAAAASLLAARQETGQKAVADATFSRDASAAILGYKRGSSNAGPSRNQNTPSMLSTSAQRVYDSSNALIAQAGGSSTATTNQ